MNEQDATRRLKLPSIDIVHRLTTASVVSGVSRCAMRDMIDAAADEIERLREMVTGYDRVRIEYLAAWSAWIKDHSGDDIAKWLRVYASAHPATNPDEGSVEGIHRAIDARCCEAADEIDRLRKYQMDSLRWAINSVPSVGGCARDQSTTQFCAEAVRLEQELREARQEIYRLQTNAACCRTSPTATTRDGEEPHIPEAL